MAKERTRVMLDGMRSGVTLDMGNGARLLITKSEVKEIRAILRSPNIRRKVRWENLEASVTVKPPEGGSVGMNLVLRKESVKHRSGVLVKHYLNLDGNPTTFFHADNYYGSPDTRQLIDAFLYCIGRVEDRAGMKFPERVVQAIRNREIALSSLEFAMYSNPLPRPLKVIQAWRWTYQMPYMMSTGVACSFASMLKNVSFTTEDYSKASYGEKEMINGEKVWRIDMNEEEVQEWQEFRVSTRSGANIDRMLCAYYKAGTVLDMNPDADVPDDLQGRIRFDLHLNRTWFKDKRIHTLADLERMVASRGGWHEVLHREINVVFDRCALRQIFLSTLDRSTWDLEKFNETAHRAMVNARLEMGMPTERKLRMIERGDGDKLVAAYRRQAELIARDGSALVIDMSPLKITE